ncbi:hypothetical protein Poli38472_007330 [Pythium oligandrum]|uniref:Multiple inositol polyphosphate phosphatase 1 n=1 Tax=Pythium oligandrum TaxID=41045 RepID=A0A8K1C9W6_PYTOL|nr:hypothetical protein Poli38472_007330 [Pythium oligandrum]|eukprot:TMW59185.1 hypothetical protein Poli38472_007330 [Pythium oligandrum]
MWGRFTLLALLLALVGSVDAQIGKMPSHLIRPASPRDPLFDLETTMASKTAFWDLRTDKRQVSVSSTPQVVRHGTSYPNKSDMKDIQALLTKLQSFSNVPSWLKDYKLPYDLSVEEMLSPSGFTDLQSFGMRTRKTLNSAIPMSFSSDKFVLQHTYKSRTKFSAMAFASTFFDNALDVTYDAHSGASDRLLRFFDECPRYLRDVFNDDNAVVEMTRFASRNLTDDIETLRAKLNLPVTAYLTASDVQMAYSACAFGLALNKRRDNWCTLMTEKLVKDVEFGEDLESFCEESYVNPVNYEIAAVLLKDIYQNMKDLIDRKSSVVGNFRFAHGETTMPLLTLLGLVDKTKLTADMQPSEVDARKFRTSRLALFIANIDFRLYRRKIGSPVAYFVQVRVNEQPVVVPGCEDSFCDIRTFESIFKTYLTTFNFDNYCTI